MSLYIEKILWILLLLFSFELVNAQTKRALIIGLGQQEDTSWGKINGDKDMPIVKDLLVNAGYEQNIMTLVNKQATKSNIVKAFTKLAASCKNGDVVYVHFSGHGQQMKDVNGDERDGLDECWIPYDAYKTPCKKDYGEKHLSDDEINVLLKNIRAKVGQSGKILVVVDACHSGDSSRGDDDEVVRGVTEIFNSVVDKIKRRFLVSNSVNDSESINQELWITISACKSNQVNSELKKPSVGKLTYAISQLLKNDKAIDNKSIELEIRTFVNRNSKYPQTPVVTGEKGRYNIIDILK